MFQFLLSACFRLLQQRQHLFGGTINQVRVRMYLLRTVQVRIVARLIITVLKAITIPTQEKRAQRMLGSMDGKVPTILLIVVSIWFWSDHRSLSEEVSRLNDQIDSLDYKVSTYSDALDEANSNIEDAQSYAWSSYNDMGDALDNLKTVEP